MALFAFDTYKRVRIKSVKLWLLEVFILSSAALLILYVAAYKGTHLELVDVRGLVQLRLLTPTRAFCNPTKVASCALMFHALTQLPYCNVSETPSPEKLQCMYMDAQRLSSNTADCAEILVATRVSVYEQRLIHQFGKLSRDWDVAPKRLFAPFDESSQRGDALRPVEQYFIAEPELFWLVLDHSVELPGGTLQKSSDMPGTFWTDDHGFRKIKCLPGEKMKECPDGVSPIDEEDIDSHGLAVSSRTPFWSEKKKKEDAALIEQGRAGDSFMQRSRAQSNLEASFSATQPEATQSNSGAFVGAEELGVLASEAQRIIKTKSGDFIQIDDLLDFLNISLDAVVPDDITLRGCGVAITIHIDYFNTEPWVGLKTFPWSTLPPKYRIHASGGETSCIATEETQLTDDKRVVIRSKGIKILVEQYGKIRVWDWWRLCMTCATAVTLLGTVFKALDLILSKVTPKYAEAKYEIHDWSQG